MKNNDRSLFILKYLFDNTDPLHTSTIVEINNFLRTHDLDADRKTITECIRQLIGFGYDIHCIRKSQNHFYLNSRSFSLPEIKLLVDAVQSSRFISESNSFALIEKLSKLVSGHHGELMKRNLYIDSRTKSENTEVTNMIQIINDAINLRQKIAFQYYEYNQHKEKVLKHDGKEYTVSPHTMVWNIDQYYVVGYSDDRHKECRYRLDRMCSVMIRDEASVPKSENFQISSLFNQEFSMMNGEHCEVHLFCKNDLMDSIIDKFGINVQTRVVDDNHFEVVTPVKLSGTFFGWVFASQGKMKITSPTAAVNQFNDIIKGYQ